MVIMPAKIVIRDLNLAFTDNSPILHHINLEFKAGKITGLIGPSGSGKSISV